MASPDERQDCGVITSYSIHYTKLYEGSASDKFRFTSALPVQVLKGMAPLLQPYLEPDVNTLCMAPTVATKP